MASASPKVIALGLVFTSDASGLSVSGSNAAASDAVGVVPKAAFPADAPLPEVPASAGRLEAAGWLEAELASGWEALEPVDETAGPADFAGPPDGSELAVAESV